MVFGVWIDILVKVKFANLRTKISFCMRIFIFFSFFIFFLFIDSLLHFLLFCIFLKGA